MRKRRRCPLDIQGWLEGQLADCLTRWMFAAIAALSLLMLGAQLAHLEHRDRESRLQAQRDAARAQLAQMQRSCGARLAKVL